MKKNPEGIRYLWFLKPEHSEIERIMTMKRKNISAGKIKLAGTALLIAAMSSLSFAADVNLTVTTPSRAAQSIADVPASVEVIMPEQIQAAPGDTLDQKLQNLVPGIITSRSAGIYSQSGTLSMRGYSGAQDTGARVLVMLDGMPLNSSATGGVIWNDLIFQDIERIEVVKGAGSSIYGANAMAGVINIITKSRKGYEVSASYGTYNTYRVGAKAGFDMTDSLFLELSANTLQSDGYITTEESARRNNGVYKKADVDMKQGGVKAIYKTGDNIRLGLTYNYSERYNGEEFQKNGFSSPDYRQNDTHMAQAKWEGRTEQGSGWEIGGNFKNVHYEKLQTNKDALAKVERQDYGMNANLTSEFDGMTLTMGVDANNGAVFGKDLTYTTGAHYGDDDGKRYNIAPYIQAQKKFMENRLGILAGLRYDYAGFYDGYSRNTNGGGIPQEYKDGKNLEDKNWEEFSPKVAVNYKYSDSISQYAGWSHGFNGPALENMVLAMWRGGRMQLPNEDLKPETSDTVETGFTVNPAEGLFIEPNAYYTKTKDYIYTKYFTDGVTNYRQYQNIGEAQIYGFEIPVRYQAGNLSLSASYAQSHSKVLEGEEEGISLNGKTLADAPHHIWAAGISYMFPHQTQLSVNWTHKGQSWVDVNNTTYIRGYSTTAVALTSQISKAVQIGVSADNVFNERFLDSEDTLAPGRTITGSVKINF